MTFDDNWVMARPGPIWAFSPLEPVHYPVLIGTGRHAKQYDRVLDIIQGYLVGEGKRIEGKHRKNLYT